jgi:hypothetical protein
MSAYRTFTRSVVRRTYVSKIPSRPLRRLSTINQKLALFTHLSHTLVRLAGGIAIENLTPSERRRLQAATRLLHRELDWSSDDPRPLPTTTKAVTRNE